MDQAGDWIDWGLKSSILAGVTAMAYFYRKANEEAHQRDDKCREDRERLQEELNKHREDFNVHRLEVEKTYASKIDVRTIHEDLKEIRTDIKTLLQRRTP